MAQQLIIYALGALAAAATLAMLFQTDPLRAALSMLTVLTATAGIYILLSAQLVAFLQVIVYAGAIMVLFILAINTLPFDAEGGKPQLPTFLRLAGLAGAAVLLAELLQLVLPAGARLDLAFVPESVDALSALLFGPYAFQFELVSLVVLAGIVGAVATAKRKL
ncbi:MAG: NADH-quinone oxidoreductase subunit J [Elusimicrobiales bacterium]|jgi:NADH-quinone oxidoreductase subunit J